MVVYHRTYVVIILQAYGYYTIHTPLAIIHLTVRILTVNTRAHLFCCFIQMSLAVQSSFPKFKDLEANIKKKEKQDHESKERPKSMLCNDEHRRDAIECSLVESWPGQSVSP